MKNILVTGGCGFIGSVFVRYILEESGFTGRIINLDKLTYAGNPENLLNFEELYKDRYIFVHEDICKKDALDKVFSNYNIDTVCHFAAESHVDRSIVSPEAFIETNINGTFNLLEASRKRLDKIKLFHHVSTDEVFGSLGAEGYFTETTPYSPNSPYSASKAGSDHLVRAYSETYGLPVTVSNCSNNYGPYQFPEKLIPLMIINAMEDKPLPIYGDGANIRDWLYVADHCRAIWQIMNNGEKGETYNVGGKCEKRNLEVVETICSLMDEAFPSKSGKSKKDLITFVKDRPGHDKRYAIDCTKIENSLGWHPVESFESGIKATIEWYLENQTWVDRIKSGEYLKWIDGHYNM